MHTQQTHSQTDRQTESHSERNRHFAISSVGLFSCSADAAQTEKGWWSEVTFIARIRLPTSIAVYVVAPRRCFTEYVALQQVRNGEEIATLNCLGQIY